MKKITFIPNRGGRFGHQFTEWLTAYVYCKANKYEFYHHPFIGNSKNLDYFLNLSFNEKLFENYKGKVLTINDMNFEEYLSSDNEEDLYVYDFFNSNKWNLNISNDMLIDDKIRDILRNKYFNKHQKNNNNVISVHIRRDDVTENSKIWSSRYMGINYFVNVLNELYDNYPTYEVKIFSSNIDHNFYDIKNIKYKNLSFHINESIESTIHEMINSKILITSNSGISFIASIISDKNNIKICSNNFWHKWPNESVLKNIKI
jgi:hypothetical protein